MLNLLRALLFLLGLSAVLICIAIFLFGPTATALFFERTYAEVTYWRGPLTPVWPPTMDSELRFYAPLFGAFGVLLIWVARDYPSRNSLVPWLASVFFMGGAGRAISFFAVGPPHPFFILLISLELSVPAGLIGLWLSIKSRVDPPTHR